MLEDRQGECVVRVARVRAPRDAGEHERGELRADVGHARAVRREEVGDQRHLFADDVVPDRLHVAVAVRRLPRLADLTHEGVGALAIVVDRLGHRHIAAAGHRHAPVQIPVLDRAVAPGEALEGVALAKERARDVVALLQPPGREDVRLKGPVDLAVIREEAHRGVGRVRRPDPIEHELEHPGVEVVVGAHHEHMARLRRAHGVVQRRRHLVFALVAGDDVGGADRQGAQGLLQELGVLPHPRDHDGDVRRHASS